MRSYDLLSEGKRDAGRVAMELSEGFSSLASAFANVSSIREWEATALRDFVSPSSRWAAASLSPIVQLDIPATIMQRKSIEINNE